VDRDTSALQVSEALCNRIGYGERMSFACEDITQESSNAAWQSCQVVFLAALVGTDTHTKLNILKSMAKKLAPGTLVVARSAQGMRSVLYPVSFRQVAMQSCSEAEANQTQILELSEDLQSIGFEILAEVHPWTKVVNSVIVLRVKER
jgi:nicotianamine synthase